MTLKLNPYSLSVSSEWIRRPSKRSESEPEIARRRSYFYPRSSSLTAGLRGAALWQTHPYTHRGHCANVWNKQTPHILYKNPLALLAFVLALSCLAVVHSSMRKRCEQTEGEGRNWSQLREFFELSFFSDLNIIGPSVVHNVTRDRREEALLGVIA